jgi:hypothetical protein
MIDDDPQFEAALNEAGGFLRQPPAQGSPEHRRLMALLQDIAVYRPRLMAPASGLVSEQRARLVRHLDEFEARVTPHYGPHWSALIGGDLRGT